MELCRYYAQGCCTRGSSCIYAHDRSVRASSVCRFYLQGNCTYGSSCRYDHVRTKQATAPGPKRPAMATPRPIASAPPPQATVPATAPVPSQEAGRGVGLYSATVKVGLVDVLDTSSAKTILCPFAQKGPCRFGSDCGYLHGDPCPVCGCLCLHPDQPAQRQEHMDGCLQRQQQQAARAEAVGRSAGLECAVCLDVVTAKSTPAQRRFGILENCEHVFCLGCIRTWRTEAVANSLVRCCPLCRQPSHYVTPSTVWPATAEEKAAIIDGYKAHLGTVDCKHFRQGEGECPFGSSCFYRHAYPDGTPAVPSLRILGTAEGTLQVQNKVRLWDFLRRETGTPTVHSECTADMSHGTKDTHDMPQLAWGQ